MSYKNENSVYGDLVTLCTQGLEWAGITGFTVKRANQVVNVNSTNPIVLIDRISSNQFGFQYPKEEYNKKEDNFDQKSCFIQDIKFNIRGLKRRAGIQQTPEISTSEDAIRGLMSYFQSPAGRKACSTLGYSVIKPKANPEPFFISDSDQYEKSPSFDIVLPVVQSYDHTIGKIAEVDGEEEPI